MLRFNRDQLEICLSNGRIKVKQRFPNISRGPPDIFGASRKTVSNIFELLQIDWDSMTSLIRKNFA